MRKKRVDLMDEYPIAEFIYTIVALCIFGLAYTFFAITEREPAPVKLPQATELDSVG